MSRKTRVSTEKIFSQFEMDENDNEWHTLTVRWKERALKAEASLTKLRTRMVKALAKAGAQGAKTTWMEIGPGDVK